MELPEFSHQEIGLPQTLKEARQNLITLPGVEEYVAQATGEAEIDIGLERMVTELNKYLDAEGSIDFISFSLALTEGESQKFFSMAGRRPFRSNINLAESLGERREQFLVIGTYLRLKYEEARKTNGLDESSTRQKAETLHLFYTNSSYNLFSQAINSLQDKVHGVHDREHGTRPTKNILSLMRQVAVEVASEYNTDSNELYRQVLAATENGNYEIALSFLVNHQGDNNLRRALEKTIEQRTKDRALTIEKLQLLWQLAKYRLLMGIDLETLYELNQLPGGSEIESKLHEFLNNKAHVSEMRGHLDREASSCLQGDDKNAPIDFWQMLEARASYHKFGSDVETKEQLEDKKKRIWRELSQYLPSISFEETPENYMGAPTRLGAKLRPYNVTYQNQEGRLVNFVILNARNQESLFATQTGHELGHKLHARVLRAAEDAGYVPEQSWDKLPKPVAEEFSQIVEDQVGKMRRKGESKKPEAGGKLSSEWRDLLHAYSVRSQAPYALVQRNVRLRMEEIWRQGKGDALTTEEAEKLIEELEPQIKQFYAQGVEISSPHRSILNNINLENPLDGLVYLLKYIEEPKGEKAEGKVGYLSMREAFEKRFGEIWIDNPDARVVLFSLMAESGKEHDISKYADFIESEDVGQAKKKLAGWGIEKI